MEHLSELSVIGVPLSDQTSFFRFTEAWGIRHSMASAEHPQTNGLVERLNRVLSETLAGFVNSKHTDWDTKLRKAIFAINTAKQSTILKSPYELVFGRMPNLPVDYLFPTTDHSPEREENYFNRINRWRKTARELIIRRQKKSKEHEDQRRRLQRKYEVGDLVLVTRKRIAIDKTKKFIARSVGPYQVVKQMGPVSYKVEDLPFNRRGRVYRCFSAHVSQMHPFRTRRETEWRPDLWQDPPPVAFEEIPEPILPDISPPFLTEEGEFHGFDPPETPPDEFNDEEDGLDSSSLFEAEDTSTPLIPVDSQTTRFGRVSRRRNDPDYIYS